MILLMNVDKDNPSVAEGENVQIQGAGLTGFELKGNTEQTTYTGKNLFDINAITEGKFYYIDQNRIVGNANWNMSDYIKVNGNTNYIASYIKSTNYSQLNYSYYDENKNLLGGVGTASNTDNYSILTPANAYYIRLGYRNNGDYILSNIQLEQGSTATSYEPYVGGIPSPNPDYPQPIEVVTGNNTINIRGKNLAKSFVNGELLNRYRPSLYVEADFEVGKKYAISFVDKSVGNSYYRNEYLMQNVPLYSITATGERQTYYFECKSNDKTDSNLYVEGKGFDIFKNDAVLEQLPQFEDIQIEEVTSYDIPSTPYEPYQSQTYPLNLGTIELCKIEDYQDYIYKENNKWYKHSEIGKVVLDGSETYGSFSNNRFRTPVINKANDGFTTIISICNILTATTQSSTTSTTQNNIIAVNGDYIWLRITNSTTEQELKTLLQNTNAIVYYVLATPTNDEITDTELKEDLETISNIALFEGVNNISMESSNLTSSFKVYYDTWYEFDKIIRNGYNIREDRDRITQKFANGHRKQFVSDYVDCSITLNLDTIDKDTTQDYLQRLKSGAYKYYSIDGKEYRTAQFIIENKPELSVESSISNNVDVNEYQITLLKAGE